MSWQVAKPSQPKSARKSSLLIGERWGVAQVILSFGARDGGAMLAQWLRERIMERMGYKRRDNVYIDTIGLRDVPGTRFVMVKVMERETAGGCGSWNDNWKAEYLAAMRSSHTMVFLFTDEWWKSQNCSLELSHFRTENLERARDGRPPLRGVGLVFPDFPGKVPGGITPIRAERKYAVTSAKDRVGLGGNYREFYTVDDAVLGRLMGLIGTR